MKNFKENILKEKDDLEINEKSSKGYAYTYEMLYARNNYGTKQNPKKYLQVRSWVPFIEIAGTIDIDSKLKASNLDQIERIELPTAGSTSSAPSTEGWV